MLYLKALGFLILIPGIVALLVPWLILRVSQGSAQGFSERAYVAGPGLAIGVLIYLSCVWHFARHGRGTLSPTQPPQRLVVSGVYRYVRNPMYVCAAIVLSSEAVLFSSVWLWLYTVVASAGYAAFVVLWEEPDLRRRFGAAYEDYLAAVPRWLPHVRGPQRRGPSRAPQTDRSR